MFGLRIVLEEIFLKILNLSAYSIESILLKNPKFGTDNSSTGIFGESLKIHNFSSNSPKYIFLKIFLNNIYV